MGIHNIRLPRDLAKVRLGKEGMAGKCADHLPKIEGEPNSSNFKVGRIHLRLDHVPIAKIHLSPAATMRKMFCEFCPQVPLYICQKHLHIYFLNDLFCKMESVIRFFLV